MTQTCDIPRDERAMTKALDGLGALLTAKAWQRAAIVYAFTYEGVPGPKGNRSDTGPNYTITAFAALKLHGLHRKETVIQYRRAWLDNGGNPDIGPGSRKVQLPDIEWPGQTRTGTDGYASMEGAVRTIERIVEKHGPIPIAHVIQNDRGVKQTARRIIERESMDTYQRVRDANAVGEQVEHNAARALNMDVATQHLRSAASEVAAALYYREQFGIEDEAAWAEAMARIQRFLSMAQASTAPVRWSDDDRAFLDDMGVQL